MPRTPMNPTPTTPDPFASRPRRKRSLLRLLPYAAAIALPSAYVLSLASSALPAGGLACVDQIAVQADQTKLATFLGVQTASLAPGQSRQLELAEGFGLAVLAVSNDSPAEAAGLQAGDVLFKVDDQMLVNPEQIAALVRSYEVGDTVDLTILRDGEMDVLEAELGERELPPIVQFNPGRAELRLGGAPGGQLMLGNGLNAQQRAQIEEAMRDVERQLQDMELQLDRDLRRLEVLPGRLLDLRPLQNGRMSGSTSIRMTDEDGQIEYRSGGGVATVVVKDTDGEVLYDGPMPASDEAMNDLPPEVAERLRNFKVSQKLNIPEAPATPNAPAEPEAPDAERDDKGRVRI